jgi:hypothetical protein
MPVEAQRLIQQVATTADSWHYRFIWEALNAIMTSECPEEDCIEREVDNADLCAWLAADPSRASYVNRGVCEIAGLPDTDQFDLFEIIRTGLYLERSQVYSTVLGYLYMLANQPHARLREYPSDRSL